MTNAMEIVKIQRHLSDLLRSRPSSHRLSTPSPRHTPPSSPPRPVLPPFLPLSMAVLPFPIQPFRSPSSLRALFSPTDRLFDPRLADISRNQSERQRSERRMEGGK